MGAGLLVVAVGASRVIKAPPFVFIHTTEPLLKLLLPISSPAAYIVPLAQCPSKYGTGNRSWFFMLPLCWLYGFFLVFGRYKAG